MATNDDSAQDDVARRRGYQGMFDPLIAHHSRLLDPTKATKLGDEVFDTTLYVADRVLVRGTPVDNGGLDTFQKWCAERGYTLTPDPVQRDSTTGRGSSSTTGRSVARG